MTVYECKDYREFLRFKVNENRGQRGYQADLARAAGCQRSLLSKVLNSAFDLTRDHAARLCLFWRLDDAETEFFMTLLDMARAGTSELRAICQKKMIRLKNEKNIISHSIESEKVGSQKAEMTYYSAWYWSAVHICTTLDSRMTSEAIASRLRLPQTLVLKVLKGLEEMGLIRKSGNHWSTTKANLHLGENSVMRVMHHLNWRQRAMNNIEEQDLDALHFSSVLTISRDEAVRIREMLSQFLVKIRSSILNSPSEELFCLNTDFFQI